MSNGARVIYLEVLFILFLIFLNGIFAMSELAIVSAKKVHLKRLAEEGSKSARLALDFSQDTGRFLPTVQIGITLIGVLSGAFSGATLATPLTHYLEALGLNTDTAEFISVTGIVVVVTYFTLIIGELVPKELALRNPEGLALFISPIIYWLSRVTSPVVSLLDVSCRTVLKVIGAGEKPKTTVTEEEVRSMIDEGTEHGLFEEAERDMISGIMLLADKPISAFMLPRIDVISISRSASLDEIRQTLAEHPYSRYPVYDGPHRDIVGILQAKDMLNYLLSGKQLDTEALLVDVPTFAEITSTMKVIEYLRTVPVHMAIIVDEYGLFVGIITLTDLVEVITGELYEHGDTGMEMVQRDDGSWAIDASILLEIAFEEIGITSMPKNANYHTLAGFMLQKFGIIPKVGDKFHYKGYRFEVIDMDGNRIDKVLIRKIVKFKKSAPLPIAG